MRHRLAIDIRLKSLKQNKTLDNLICDRPTFYSTDISNNEIYQKHYSDSNFSQEKDALSAPYERICSDQNGLEDELI
jgi:hypothetical protein